MTSTKVHFEKLFSVKVLVSIPYCEIFSVRYKLGYYSKLKFSFNYLKRKVIALTTSLSFLVARFVDPPAATTKSNINNVVNNIN